MAQAKAAAGHKDVTVVGGASTIQQCLGAGLADELHIDIMPVLLCGGLRLFEALGAEPIQLERRKAKVNKETLRANWMQKPCRFASIAWRSSNGRMTQAAFQRNLKAGSCRAPRSAA